MLSQGHWQNTRKGYSISVVGLYMLETGIIPKKQNGFVPKKTTVTNLLESLRDRTSSNLDKQISTDVLYLVYSKCFDKVCHKKLLHKLSRYGVTGSTYHWL